MNKTKRAARAKNKRKNRPNNKIPITAKIEQKHKDAEKYIKSLEGKKLSLPEKLAVERIRKIIQKQRGEIKL